MLSSLLIKPTVVALSETWLSPGDENYYNLPGYSFISSPRLDKRGGGVGLYISNSVTFSVCTKLTNTEMLKDVCEHLTVEINLTIKHKILLSSIYRPPGQDLLTFSKNLTDYLSLAKKNQ